MLEGLQEQGIKTAARSLEDHFHRGIVREHEAQGARGAQIVVRVGEGDDAGGERNIVAGQTVRIAAAVEVLVMMAGDVDGHVPKRRRAAITLGDRLQGLGADRGVRLQDDHVLRIEPPGSAEDVIGEGDVADVVQQRARFQSLQKGLVEGGRQPGRVPRPPRQGAHVTRHARQVPGRFLGARFHDFGQGENQGVAGMHLIAVAGEQGLLQLGIDAQELLIELFGAVLGRLVLEGGLDARDQFLANKRFGQIVVRSQGEHCR